MQNLSNGKLAADQRSFLDDFARLLAAWNMPSNTARVYGYLLLQNEPAGLDQIARDLEISKSNACTAAKVLETWGHCRRIGERGTKRVLYVAREDLGTSFLPRTATFGQLNELVSASAENVASGAAVDRLRQLAAFYHNIQIAMENVIAADTNRPSRLEPKRGLSPGKSLA